MPSQLDFFLSRSTQIFGLIPDPVSKWVDSLYSGIGADYTFSESLSPWTDYSLGTTNIIHRMTAFFVFFVIIFIFFSLLIIPCCFFYYYTKSPILERASMRVVGQVFMNLAIRFVQLSALDLLFVANWTIYDWIKNKPDMTSFERAGAIGSIAYASFIPVYWILTSVSVLPLDFARRAWLFWNWELGSGLRRNSRWPPILSQLFFFSFRYIFVWMAILTSMSA